MPVRTIILSNLPSNLYQCRINSCKAQNTSNNKFYLHEVSGKHFLKKHNFKLSRQC